jgi:hypothetical protein
MPPIGATECDRLRLKPCNGTARCELKILHACGMIALALGWRASHALYLVCNCCCLYHLDYPDSRASWDAGCYQSHRCRNTLPFDREKWQALERYDPELAMIASKLRVLGDKWVDEFARAYLALNDKKYLPNIVQKIIDDARLEAKELEQKLEQKKIARKEAWSSLAFTLSLFALAGLIVAAVGIGGKIWGH